MNNSKNKKIKIQTRHKRIRAKISGTSLMPRLSIYRSNTSVYGQIINDDESKTLVSFSASQAKGKNLTEKSLNAGKEIAKLAIEKGIKKVVFDRGGFIYTGKIKSFAEGAREGGLQF